MTINRNVSSDIHGASSEKTFLRRLKSIALWWGIPALGVELIAVPRHLWIDVLIFILPATAAGVFSGALIQHYTISRKAEK